MNFPRAASPILCAGTSLIGVRFQTPGTQHLIPLCLLAAVRETGILPKVEMKEWECEIKALTSPPLPLALSNSGETLRDLKAWRLVGMLSSSGRRAAGSDSPAPTAHSASPVWAEQGGRGGTAHPGQVGELCRKSRRLRAQHGSEQRSERQGDWFFGSVAATGIRARRLRPEPGPGCGLLWVGAGGRDGRTCSG